MGPNNNIQGSTSYQRSIQRAMAQMIASGSWKPQMIQDIYNTMAEGDAKKQLSDIMVGAKNEAAGLQSAEQRRQFNEKYSLARDNLNSEISDNRWGNLISLAGLGVSGYTGYQDYLDRKKESALTRQMAQDILRRNPNG